MKYKSKLKKRKYDTGGPYEDIDSPIQRGADGNPITDQSTNPPKSKTIDYGGYASAAMNSVNAIQKAEANPNLNSAQKTSTGVNSTIDAVAGVATPWYGYAKMGSDMGRSFIDRDKSGVPIDSTNKQLDAVIKPQHQMAVDDASKGNYGLATAEMFLPGIGYESRSNSLGLQGDINRTFDSDNTTNYTYEKGGPMNNNFTEFNGGFKHNDNSPENVNEGIPLGKTNNVVQKGETAYKDYIFPGKELDGTDYSAKSVKIKNTYSKRPNDTLSNEQMDKELKDLSTKVEQSRQQKDLELQTKNNKILNRAYKKVFGGRMNYMFEGGFPEKGTSFIRYDENGNPIQANNEFAGSNSTYIPENTTGPINSDYIEKPFYPTLDGNIPKEQTGKPGYYLSPNKKSKNYSFDPNSLYNIGNFAGSAYDIYRGSKGGDSVNYDRVNPDLVDYSKTRELGAKNILTGYRDTKNALKGVNNPAQYLSLIGQQAGKRNQDIGDLYTKSVEAEQNTNAGIKNNAKQFNAQTQRAEADANQMEKDISSNILGEGLRGVGAAFSGTGRDKSAEKSQNESKKYIGSQEYGPAYNDEGKEIKGYRRNKITGKLTKI